MALCVALHGGEVWAAPGEARAEAGLHEGPVDNRLPSVRGPSSAASGDGAGTTASPQPAGRTVAVPLSAPAPSRGSYSEVGEVEEPARTVVGHAREGRPTYRRRAASVVTRRDLDERLPRSAPDALRYEPGVYVQQTAHAQGSPYVRGLTGQQTLMMFDGVRLNNSTFRQGPNQYFFTIDSHTLRKLEVIRGSASTEFGSDAIGGALLATPLDPQLPRAAKGWHVHPRAMLRTATADGELGGRGQVDIGYGKRIGLLTGAGYRDVGLLRTGGLLTSPADGSPVRVPLYADDNRTQLGTGFREFTADARLVFAQNRDTKWTLAYYDYRQFDAPRTDKCPPPTAPVGECLIYDNQDRTLVYTSLDRRRGPAAAQRIRWNFSYQHQRENRHHEYGDMRGFDNYGLDHVHAFGTALRFNTKSFAPTPWLQTSVEYGLDGYLDSIKSRAWTTFTDTAMPIEVERARGQYVDGSNYLTSGVWTRGQLVFGGYFGVHAGARGALVVARAPEVEEASSQGVKRQWGALVGHAGMSLKTVSWLTLLANFDQGFRAPNLDDLTSRQQVGAGFQLENAALEPERSRSLEAGFRIEHPWIQASMFGFVTAIDGMIGRTQGLCPANTGDGCGEAGVVLQLTNLEGRSTIRGFDGQVRVFFPAGFAIRNTLAYAHGVGPNPIAGSAQPTAPLSRIPPLNGTTEVSWRSARFGLYAAAGLRWALLQDRLAFADIHDVRIPEGGTPGYTVIDVRAGYRFDPYLVIALVFENIADTAYRYHGSSVNGPGRGLNINLQYGF